MAQKPSSGGSKSGSDKDKGTKGSGSKGGKGGKK
jgi:hypothetical protein